MEKTRKQIIIKLGRSIVTNDDNSLNKKLFTHLAHEIKELQKKDFGVILVVSGAVVSGKKMLTDQINTLHKGLLAGIGQISLSCEIHDVFSKEYLVTGQMLLTKDDLKNYNKRKQLKEISKEAIDHNIVLVFNENDAIELGTFSGNDFLAASLAKVIHASHVVLLTDVEGVFDKDMHVLASLKKSELRNIAHIKKENDKGQIGGMKAKIQAAFDARKYGASCIIAHGKTPRILTKLFIENKKVGTEII